MDMISNEHVRAVSRPLGAVDKVIKSFDGLVGTANFSPSQEVLTPGLLCVTLLK